MKDRSKIVDWLVYAVIRCFIAFFQTLPLSFCYKLASGLARLAFVVNKRHRKVAMENLAHAYPEMNDEERELLVRSTYLHFFMMMMEMMHLPRLLRINTWCRYITMENGDLLVRALLSGRPVLVVTGHFGNWELAGCALAMFGFKSVAVARTIDNPYLDQLIRRFRKHTGQELLNKKGDSNRMEEVLQSNGILCTLADQDAGKNGLFVDFFGKPASTHKGVGLLALHHEALVVIVGAFRNGREFRYTVRTEQVLDTRDYLSHPQPIQSLTRDYTLALESLVRHAPEQYLWLHRRWKHQPQPKRLKQAA